MKLKEAILKLNKKAFNLNYNYNTYNWELVIFNDMLDIELELKASLLNTVLSLYLKENVKVESEFLEVENFHNIELELNFDNIDTEENFFKAKIYDYEFPYELKEINDLINILESVDYIVEIDKQNAIAWDYEEKEPYASRGLDASDFLSHRI